MTTQAKEKGDDDHAYFFKAARIISVLTLLEKNLIRPYLKNHKEGYNKGET